MVKYYSKSAILILSLSLHFILINCKTRLVPALYVFGDSQSDSGNNNYLQTIIQVNYKPYGIDFPYGVSTGRFCNGRTIIDFITQFLGLPFVPPYLALSNADKNQILTGINYASGGGGILPESGSATGNILSITKQINYFQSTLRNNLHRNFYTRFALRRYLANSIFYVAVGSNDYINNYLQPESYSTSKIYTPQQFADLLLYCLSLHLLRLYNLGATKFVVFNVGRLGCLPAIISLANPRPTTPCAEDINSLVMLYNTKFPSMITTLERKLVGSTFVRGDGHGVNQSSADIGFTETPFPCCETSNITGLCLPNSTPCRDRSKTIFWEAFHPSEVANYAEAIACFYGSVKCGPINFEQLARGPKFEPQLPNNSLVAALGSGATKLWNFDDS